MDGDLTDVPESLSRSAFRVVQEVLTNRRKHALGQPLTVRIERRQDRIAITAHNPIGGTPTLALPDSGLGLVGLGERVSLAGGTLRHGVDRSGHFCLEAVLPMRLPNDEGLDA